MGITALSLNGDYGHENPEAAEQGFYSEDSEAEPVDRTGLNGTIDTSGVGPGQYEDLRNVTRTFDRSDARIAQQIEDADADSVDDLNNDPESGVQVEGADPDAKPTDLAESLRQKGQEAAHSGLNPASGDPEQVAQVRSDEQAKIDAENEANSGGGNSEEDVKSTVEDGTVPDLKEAVGDDADLAQVALDEEKAKPADEQRSSAIEYLEGVIAKAKEANVQADYNPADHTAPEVVEYLKTVPDAEVERVQTLEADRKPNPRTTITNFGA